ncbi:hypothetical protein GCM10008097_21870 [Mycetocola manganoxydans]|nr:hypothetical protein GCM10008097_21870 [Mycetocola manganoxydans]
MHIRARNCENKTRKAGTGTDITNQARTQKRGDEGAVEHMTGPQAGELEGTDQTQLFSVLREVLGEPASELESITQEGRGGSRLGLKSGVSHVGLTLFGPRVW